MQGLVQSRLRSRLWMSPRVARVQPLDVERELAARFGFSTAEVEQVRAGQIVAKTLPQASTEIGVFGAVRIPDDKERLVRWVRDIEGFRKAADLGLARKLKLTADDRRLRGPRRSTPASWTPSGSASRATARSRLGDRAIAGFRTARATGLRQTRGGRRTCVARRLLLGYAEAYLRGGDEGTGGGTHDEQKPRVVADDFRALIQERHEPAMTLAGPAGLLPRGLTPKTSASRVSSSSSTGPRVASGPTRRSRSTTS